MSWRNQPVLSEIPLSVPHLAGREAEYLQECIDTNFVSSVGPFVERFEREMAERIGVAHAVATVNGTAALHIALLLAGVKPNEEVLVPCLTFVAPANAVRYVGAWPVFIDVEPRYFQMDAAKLAAFLQEETRAEGRALRNRRTGRRIAAILPVDLLGHPCDIDAILALAASFDVPVVEDATESLGAVYRGRPVGSVAHVACFSFNGNKIITCGGGGMIVTNNRAWADRGRYLTTQAKDDPIEYVHNEIGYNYRLTNVLAALGCAQLEQLDAFVEAKRRTARAYRAALSGVAGLRPMIEHPDATSTFWLYTVLVDEEQFGMSSRSLMRLLGDAGIHSRRLWAPLHRLPPFSGAQRFCVTEADRIQAEALSLPSSVGLQSADLQRVIDAIEEARS